MSFPRKMRSFAGIGALIGFGWLQPASAFQTSGFEQTQIASGLSSPTAMQFSPDGRLFVAQQSGRLRVIKNGALLPADFITLSVTSNSERGLLGIAFDPNFSTNRFIYLYYTRTTSPIKNRVSRFMASASNPDVAEPGSEVVILDNIASDAGNHNGGAMHFGLDGKLYIAIGDGGSNAFNSQSMGTLSGKLLRINSDGSIPSDNPFVGVSGARAEIWALGLRNPFTFAVDQQTGKIHVNDVGQDTYEEVNLIARGANYGWPTCEGMNCGSNPNYTNPIHTYDHGTGHAITGGAFYRATQFPSQYHGSYFFSDYLGGWIKRLDTNNQVSNFWNPQNGPVDVKIGPDGALYYLSIFNSGVYKIAVTGSNQSPTAAFTATPGSGAAPLAVSFNAGGSSDPNGDTLTYAWDFGDGSPGGTGVTVNHTYQNSGSYVATLTVDDGRGGTAGTTRTIAAGTPPTGNILTPTSGTMYNAGATISYSGSGTDAEDGTLAASRFSWTIAFHHDTHSHPFLGPINGVTSGSFQIPQTGETSANVFYRIHLTVTDSTGLTHVSTRDILPRKATLTLATNVAGLSLTLDGQPAAAPLSFDSVVGFTRTLGALSPQTIGGQTYEFVSWSDLGAQTHTINTPATNTTYTANYQISTPPPPPPPGAIALETATRSANGNDVSSISWAHTITGAGSNVVLIVGAVSRDSTDADRSVVNVTYNGASLTKVREDNEMTNNVYSSLWYLVNPPAGANTITVTYGGAVTEAFGMAASFSGVDQTSPVDANAGFTHYGVMTLNQAITTFANDAWIVDVQYAGADGSATPTSGQTALTSQAIAVGRSNDRALMTAKGPISPAGAANTSYSYSESSQVALSIVALKPAAGLPDTTPPSVPANLIAAATSTTAINLSWTASTDDRGVSGYKIYRDGNYINSTAATSYSDTGLAPSTTYSYSVAAFDAAGNDSSQSATATATTDSPAPAAPIALDAATRSANGNDVSSVSWSHTVTGAGGNVVLIVGAISRDSTDADRTVVSVTYNGASLIRVRQDDETTNNVYSSLWYLVNPTVGTHTITVTYTAAVTEAFGMAASFTGVDQASPIDANAGFIHPGVMSLNQTITTATSGAWLVDVQYAGADGSATPTSGQTVLTSQAIAVGRSNDRALMTRKGPISPSGTANTSYSYSESSQVALSIIALRPAN
jgi:glucose/arabinose dehydrogenase/chitodextrinase